MMVRLLARLALLGILGMLAVLLLSPQWQSWRVEQQFTDRIVRMAPDAAIQAGYVETEHEQHWGNDAFVNILGLTVPRGHTEAMVRAPVRVYYGVRPQALHVLSFAHGVLRLAVDRVEVLNVATDLAGMEVQTDVGWARLDSVSGKSARQAARKAFDQTRFRAADALLKSRDVTENVRLALQLVAASIAPVHAVEIERRDL
jgi:hypothetical protein